MLRRSKDRQDSENPLPGTVGTVGFRSDGGCPETAREGLRRWVQYCRGAHRESTRHLGTESRSSCFGRDLGEPERGPHHGNLALLDSGPKSSNPRPSGEHPPCTIGQFAVAASQGHLSPRNCLMTVQLSFARFAWKNPWRRRPRIRLTLYGVGPAIAAFAGGGASA
jgi:hypothetical protein